MAAVAYEKKDHVAVVTLKNAGKRHWSEPEWIAEVQAAVKQVERDLDVYVLELGKGGALHIREEQGRLSDILQRHLQLDKVELIPCGGGNPIDAAREQWSDASNTLAIAPGEVVVYSRNYVTNRLLEEHGITVHCIPSSELSRGRGGPRCMSMPFVRD